jgi:hypothetical protein
MLEISNEIVAIIGFLLGPLGRTFYDFLWKLLEDPDIPFDRRYLITLLASLGIAFFAGLVQCPGFISQLPEGSQAFIFLASFAQGFMISHVINRPLDYKRHREEEEKVG